MLVESTRKKPNEKYYLKATHGAIVDLSWKVGRLNMFLFLLPKMS